jgi:hypothetical protein
MDTDTAHGAAAGEPTVEGSATDPDGGGGRGGRGRGAGPEGRERTVDPAAESELRFHHPRLAPLAAGQGQRALRWLVGESGAGEVAVAGISGRSVRCLEFREEGFGLDHLCLLSIPHGLS